jgi:hypothetical protein
MKSFKFFKGLFFVWVFFNTSFAFAFLTVGESAEVVPMNIYRLGGGAQMRLSNGSGANIVGGFDMAASEEASYRLQMGFGETDFFVGGAYKWVPIPDYAKQPAVGLRFGGVFARMKTVNYTALRFDPIASKKFSTDYGLLIPYAAVPINLAFFESKNELQFQIAGGAEYKPHDLKEWNFGAELGINAKNSFSYILFTASYLLDEVKSRK